MLYTLNILQFCQLDLYKPKKYIIGDNTSTYTWRDINQRTALLRVIPWGISANCL